MHCSQEAGEGSSTRGDPLTHVINLLPPLTCLSYFWEKDSCPLPNGSQMKPDLAGFSCLRKTGSGWELWTTFYFALLDFYLLDKAIENGGIDCVLVLNTFLLLWSVWQMLLPLQTPFSLILIIIATNINQMLSRTRQLTKGFSRALSYYSL